MRKSIFFAVLLSASMLIFPCVGQAQSKCQEFHAMSQWIAANGPFGGPIFATLDGNILVAEGGDVQWLEPMSETCNGGTCQSRGGKLLLDFGNGDTITLTEQHGVYTPAYTTIPGFGIWRSTFSIVTGTGQFLDASGLIAQSGPWIVWIDANGFNGRYSGEFSGTICGGKSKP